MNIAPLYHEPRVYAYTLPDVPKLNGWIKVGYTDKQTSAERIAQQLKTPHLDYRIEMDEPAVTNDGRFFRDSAIHGMLEKQGFQRARFDDVDAEEKGKRGKKSEWFRCAVEDVRNAVRILQQKTEPKDAHLAAFGMRPEQARAVKMTAAYFRSHKKVAGGQPPYFLWNAKMRFGKTFTTYQLAKEMGWTKILVLTFKPAVEDSWQSDLEGHVDFRDWQFVSNAPTSLKWRGADKRRPIVWFGSFQDFLGLDKSTGEYKVRNKEAFAVDWDCVVVDEYHFGAWRSENRQFTGSIEDDESTGELGGGVFNSAQMNSCIWQFRAYEEESLDYLHVRDELADDAPLVGGWDSSIAKADAYESLGREYANAHKAKAVTREEKSGDCLRAFTVHPGWAWAILEGVKDREWRTFLPNPREGTCAVTVSKSYSPSQWRNEAKWVRKEFGVKLIPYEELVAEWCGKVVAVCDYAADEDDWDVDAYGWRLSNVRPLKRRIHCKGALKLWKMDAALSAKVRKR